MLGVILDHVLPIFLLIWLGLGLCRLRLAGEEFFKTSDRLVYRVFFPAMLFREISHGLSGAGATEALAAVPAVLLALFATWLLVLALRKPLGVAPFQTGSFAQLAIRFNAFIGMAVAQTALGAAGTASFAILIAAAIPFINLMMVGTLVWFSQASLSLPAKLRLLGRELLVNPLILGSVGGFLYSRLGLPLPVFLDQTLKLLSSITLPLALLSIGAGLSLARLRGDLRLSLLAGAGKFLCLPLLGYGLLRLLGV